MKKSEEVNLHVMGNVVMDNMTLILCRKYIDTMNMMPIRTLKWYRKMKFVAAISCLGSGRGQNKAKLQMFLSSVLPRHSSIGAFWHFDATTLGRDRNPMARLSMNKSHRRNTESHVKCKLDRVIRASPMVWERLLAE